MNAVDDGVWTDVGTSRSYVGRLGGVVALCLAVGNVARVQLSWLEVG